MAPARDCRSSAYSWGVPPQDVLDRAVALRKRLDAQVARDLPAFKDKLQLVVGKARFTPDGYEIGNEGLVYLDAADDGDGRVTAPSALLPGVRTWQLDCEHGTLPDKKSAFEAYLRTARDRHHQSVDAACRGATRARRGSGVRPRTCGAGPRAHGSRARHRTTHASCWRSTASSRSLVRQRAAPRCKSR